MRKRPTTIKGLMGFAEHNHRREQRKKESSRLGYETNVQEIRTGLNLMVKELNKAGITASTIERGDKRLPDFFFFFSKGEEKYFLKINEDYGDAAVRLFKGSKNNILYLDEYSVGSFGKMKTEEVVRKAVKFVKLNQQDLNE